MKDMDLVQEIKKECDNYKHTVWALLAFANHSMWDFEREEMISNSNYSLGRRMKITGGNVVTPDLVVQRSALYGLVCEAKRDLPKDQTLWIKDLDQMTKYDSIKEGWFTSDQIDDYDLVFITDISRSVDFGDFLEGSDKTFIHKFAIIGFEPTTETTGTFITLKREKGNLSDATLDNSLRRVTKVSLSNIESTIGKVKFYDFEAPTIYIARIFWENICGAKISKETWNTSENAHILKLTAEEISKELQEYYGQKSTDEGVPEIPSKKWIRKVLDFLIFSGYAEQPDKDDNYTILWRTIRGDILERFAELWIKYNRRINKKEKHANTTQFELF